MKLTFLSQKTDRENTHTSGDLATYTERPQAGIQTQNRLDAGQKYYQLPHQNEDNFTKVSVCSLWSVVHEQTGNFLKT